MFNVNFSSISGILWREQILYLYCSRVSSNKIYMPQVTQLMVPLTLTNLIKINRISGVMVNVLALSAVDRGFESRSDQTKDTKIGVLPLR